VVGDLRTEQGTAALVADVRNGVDRVDIVINNYGVADGMTGTRPTPRLAQQLRHQWWAQCVTQAFLPDMRAAGWGRVVFVATVGAAARRSHSEYYAAKALPVDHGEPGEAPGGHRRHGELREPRCHRHGRGRQSFTERATCRDRHGLAGVERFIVDTAMPDPSGRVPTPEDVGRFIAMAVGEPAWHLNGAHVRFDGGAADAVT
jgi:NAD(P)-dependent dehydrogenase (short-subunit alcohol dehydrogenase family)